MRVPWLAALCLTNCARGAPVRSPASPVTSDTSDTSASLTSTEVPGRRAGATPEAAVELYSFDEALTDALSGPLTHVGTGEWFGISKNDACAYRNDRVFVINLYCATKEMTAAGVVVLSPTRGRAFIYAEANAPISKLRRADYITFRGEIEPALVDATLPALSLAFGYADLRSWDAKRFHRYVPGCFGGLELGQTESGCVEALDPIAQRWITRNTPFLTEPPSAWYQIVHELRQRAKTDGKPTR